MALDLVLAPTDSTEARDLPNTAFESQGSPAEECEMNLNVRSAAQLLGVSETKIYEWVDEGIIPSFRIQDQVRFNRVELLEWAAARRMRVAPELFDDERRPANGSAFKLSKALAAGGIHRDIAAADGRSALRELGGRLPLPPGIDRSAVIEIFAAREGVTPVGGGIAIPHARAPVVIPIQLPIVALGFLARPIDIGASDGKPVGALFVVFSPTIRKHLDALSKIAFALSNPDFHGLLERQAPSEEILDRISALEAAATTPPAPTEESGSI
jgi:PTS system nitrogen regulatory IIA component